MSLWSRIRRTFHSEERDREIEEELQYHLEMKQRDGFDSRAAKLRLGNVSRLKEETREQLIVAWLESLVRDVRHGLRQLRKTPALTSVVILSLALGIGANSSIFSLVDSALLKPLPVGDPGPLHLVEWTSHGWPDPLCSNLSGDWTGEWTSSVRASSIAPRIYRELAKQQKGFVSLAGFSDLENVAVRAGARAAEQFHLQYISPNFFETLGVKLRFGRAFSIGEDRVGQPPLVIISDRLWHNLFGGSQDVLGSSIRINNVSAQIVGVAPPGFFGLQIGAWADLYAPLSAHVAFNPRVQMTKELGESDSFWWVRMITRLNPSVREATALDQLSTLFQHLVVPPGVQIRAGLVPKLVTSPGARGFDPMDANESRALWILLLLVGVILLIVCANVANLLLSRAVMRQRESAVCLALGAARLRLLRQYLIESATLAVAGGLLGLFLAQLFAETAPSLLRTQLRIGDFDLHASGRILAFTAVISLTTVLLFGIAPAWRLSKATVNEALKAHNRSVLAGRLRLPRMLVAVQIALSFAVLTASGLLGHSLRNLRSVNIGFDRRNIVYVSVNPWQAGYKSEQVDQYVERLRTRLAQIPGIVRVATIEAPPLGGHGNATTVNVPGHPFHRDLSDAVWVNQVSDGLFEVLGRPLLAGRTFEPADMRPNSDSVIVDDQFVKRYYAHTNPIGQRFGSDSGHTDTYRIIGVVKSTPFKNLREAQDPAMYKPSIVSTYPGADVTFAIRAAQDLRNLAPAIRQAAAGIDPGIPVVDIKTQTALIDRLLLTDRLMSTLSNAFGILALALSTIGLVGLLAYAVARRTNEIGVRMALGAQQSDVIRLVVKDSIALVGLGILAGLPGAFFIANLLKKRLFHLQPLDPNTAVISLLLLVAAAALASYLPARRAARVDPVAALREE